MALARQGLMPSWPLLPQPWDLQMPSCSSRSPDWRQQMLGFRWHHLMHALGCTVVIARSAGRRCLYDALLSFGEVCPNAIPVTCLSQMTGHQHQPACRRVILGHQDDLHCLMQPQVCQQNHSRLDDLCQASSASVERRQHVKIRAFSRKQKVPATKYAGGTTIFAHLIDRQASQEPVSKNAHVRAGSL